MAQSKLAADDTRWICERARAVGFELCGVTAAETFPELQRFPEWLVRGWPDDWAGKPLELFAWPSREAKEAIEGRDE